MLVDVQVCDPLCTSYKHKLAKPGAVATWRQQFKISKYKRIGLKAFSRDDKYQFCPFLIESTGAFGEAAEKLCAKFRQIRRSRNSNTAPVNDERESARDGLKEAISAELQRQNAAAVLEREPPAMNPTFDEIELITADVARREIAANGSRSHPEPREIREDSTPVNPPRHEPPEEKRENPPQPNTPIPPQIPLKIHTAGMAIQHASLPAGPHWTAIPPELTYHNRIT